VKKHNLFHVSPLILFLVLVGLVYLDSSIYDFIDLFSIPAQNKNFDLIFLTLVIIFIYSSLALLYRGNSVLHGSKLFRISSKAIYKITYLSYGVIFTCLSLLVYQIVSQSTYNIYLVYLALIASSLFALFFSISGTIKFFQWLRVSREKLSFIYLISFVAFSILICFSLGYNILQISGSPVNVTTTNYQKVTQTMSINIPEVYKFYIFSYIFSFVAIWVSTIFLLHDYLSKNFLRFLVIIILPLILFLINLLPITITIIVYLISIYPILLPLYAITSTLTFLIGPIIFSLTIFLMIKYTDNQTFKDNLLPIAYGLFLLFASTQTNIFSRVLYPPFGLISILFSGLSLFLVFTGFYSSSLYITKNYYFSKTFVNRFYQSDFFRTIAKSELEMNVKKVFKNIQRNDLFQVSEKEKIDDFNEEQVSKLIEFVKKELKNRKANDHSS